MFKGLLNYQGPQRALLGSREEGENWADNEVEGKPRVECVITKDGAVMVQSRPSKENRIIEKLPPRVHKGTGEKITSKVEKPPQKRNVDRKYLLGIFGVSAFFVSLYSIGGGMQGEKELCAVTKQPAACQTGLCDDASLYASSGVCTVHDCEVRQPSLMLL